MILLDSNTTYKPDGGSYIALGSFDGLHIGHMSLIQKAKTMAEENDGASMIYTFKNHPRFVINKARAPKLIMDNETKIEMLKSMGADALCLVDFDEKFMHMTPEEFIRQMKERYNMKGVVVGFNFRFGHKNVGNVQTLKDLALKYDYEAYVHDALKYCDEIVSSTKIRKLIHEDGNVKKAKCMLSRHFMLRGNVIHGRKIGKTIGFPTANVEIHEQLLYPKSGVYYTNVVLEDKVYKGITNIGYNPTIKDDGLTFETYILGLNRDIYGEELKVYFLERIRDEQQFKGVDDLIKQLKADKLYAELKNIEI